VDVEIAQVESSQNFARKVRVDLIRTRTYPREVEHCPSYNNEVMSTHASTEVRNIGLHLCGYGRQALPPYAFDKLYCQRASEEEELIMSPYYLLLQLSSLAALLILPHKQIFNFFLTFTIAYFQQRGPSL